MRVFLDTSALAKRYVAEPGTQTVMELCDQADTLMISVIAVPEMISAFFRLRRERHITSRQYTSLKQFFLSDITDALICETTPEVIQSAVNLLERYSLRGMDAIHLGAAQVSQADVFVSADARQCQACERLGIEVVNLSAST